MSRMIKMQMTEDPQIAMQVLSETVVVPGSSEAVMYTPQSLSDPQKAQARKNIGANAPSVHAVAGVSIHGVGGQLVMNGDLSTAFGNADVRIGDLVLVVNNNIYNLCLFKVKEKHAHGSMDVDMVADFGPFYTGPTDNTAKPLDLLLALVNGRNAFVQAGDLNFSSFIFDESVVFATGVLQDNDEVVLHQAKGNFENGNWEVSDVSLATTEYVNSQLGNISATLDGILAIQKELIGGESQ